MGCCASSKVQDVGDLRDVECLQRTPAAAREASAVLGRSFAGTETTPPELAFEWCSGGTWESPARGREALAWIMRYLVEESFAAGQKGAIVACRGAGGDLVGVACLLIAVKTEEVVRPSLGKCGPWGRYSDWHPLILPNPFISPTGCLASWLAGQALDVPKDT